jgi:hypothetical protein
MALSFPGSFEHFERSDVASPNGMQMDVYNGCVYMGLCVFMNNVTLPILCGSHSALERSDGLLDGACAFG